MQPLIKLKKTLFFTFVTSLPSGALPPLSQCNCNVKLLFDADRHEESVEFDRGLNVFLNSSEAVDHLPVVSVRFC